MHGVTPQALRAEEERHRRLELRSQKKHLEVKERLLTGCEMRLACGEQSQEQLVLLYVRVCRENVWNSIDTQLTMTSHTYADWKPITY